jgi:hypothetical protein
MRMISHFINGQHVTHTGGVTSPVYHPNTGQVQALLEHGETVILAEAIAVPAGLLRWGKRHCYRML